MTQEALQVQQRMKTEFVLRKFPTSREVGLVLNTQIIKSLSLASLPACEPLSSS